MGDVLKLPDRAPPVRCESGSPDCGPVTHFDDDDVPLCTRCWNGLEIESASQRRAREMGLSVITTPDTTRGGGDE